MLMENSNIEIIGGGLFFTEIEVKMTMRSLCLLNLIKRQLERILKR